MTIVTAIHDGQETWLGHNDSATIGDTVVASTLQPWLMFGDWALGITGESAQQNLLELHQKKLAESGSDALAVIDVIRRIFSEYDHSTRDGDDASLSYKIWCILAHKDGRIWDVDARLAITPIPKNRLWARGSGIDYALGADAALSAMSLSTKERILKATHAAILCDIYCPGEAKIFKL